MQYYHYKNQIADNLLVATREEGRAIVLIDISIADAPKDIAIAWEEDGPGNTIVYRWRSCISRPDGSPYPVEKSIPEVIKAMIIFYEENKK